VPKKKNRCDVVERGVAGPTPEDVMNIIRAEYGLPRLKPDKAKTEDVARPSPSIRTDKVKP